MKRLLTLLLLLLPVSAALAVPQSSVPPKFPLVWGQSAGSAYIRSIPQNSQIGTQNCAASLTDGFPPLTFVQASAGGCPPFGQDFNGILKQLSQWSQWSGAGGTVRYDSGFSSSIGGYPVGAILQSATPGVLWFNLVDNNATNPDSGGSNWIAFSTAPQIQSQTYVYFQDTGSTGNQLVITPVPPIAAYAAGQKFAVKIAHNILASGPNATMAVSGLSGKNIVYGSGSNLPVQTNDFLAGQILELTYDGTNFQITGGVGPNAIRNYAKPVTSTSFCPSGCTNTATAGFNFTVPATITQVTGQLWGGGGGGGGASAGTPGGAGSGGAGAGYCTFSVTVTPGDVLTGVVGAVGAQGTSGSNAGPGGNSTVTYNGTTYTANGGGGGISASAGTVANPATGGGFNTCDATQSFAGAPSSPGFFSNNGSSIAAYGGSGGNAPNGGYGGSASQGSGNSGVAPGGGGGGAGGITASTENGGFGGAGRAVFRY